jgi:O-antigen/teichoic acid export membrane protein
MKKYTKALKKTLKNKVFIYAYSRYIIYFIQFINSLFIAVYLGPYYLGVWGFITLSIQYLNQMNMGIANSVNTIISIHKKKEWYVQKIIGTSLLMLIALSVIIALFFGANELFNLNVGGKYNFSTYAPFVALIGIFGYFNTLFSSIFRVYGKVTEIAINQSAFPILMLITIILFKGEDLLWALVIANLLAFLLSFLLYIFKTPVKLNTFYISRLIKSIQVKGWHLFVYNTSFYLIILSTRSFISGYYRVEEFGYFTFAFSLANIVLLLLHSFSFLIYPKLLNRISISTNERIIELLRMVRDVYITTSHLIVHLAILFFPLFMLFFPQYDQSLNTFKIIALTVVMYTNSFGYSGLLIAKNLEKKLANLSFLALLINLLSVFILIKVFTVNFEFVFLATMFTYFIYVFLLGKMGQKELQLDTNFKSVLNNIFPFKILVPYLLSFCLIMFSHPNIYFIIPLLLFLAMNYKALIRTKQLAINLVNKPEFIDI